MIATKDMYGDPTWHMSTTFQVNSLVVAVMVAAVVFVGLRSIWTDWRKSWAAEDFAASFYADRDQHLTDIRASMLSKRHPVPEPSATVLAFVARKSERRAA